jgi:DNA topoisomerase III
VDDAKLTDHHAIIPTHKAPPAELPERQRNIYQLVATRFLSIFLPPEVRDETTAFISLAEHSFRARGVVIKDPGWTVLEPKNVEASSSKKEKDAGEDGQQLPALTKDQQVPKRKAELKTGKTSAPKPYDDSSLLTAMKNAGQELDDEDLAAYMKQRGLGTPATRAAIIERLLQTGYVERIKKTLAPTAKGKALIAQVHADLKDIGLTASWEQGLADMQDGKLPLEKFEHDIADFIRQILPEVTQTTVSLPPAEGNGHGVGKRHETAGEETRASSAGKSAGFGSCPRCQQGFVRETPKGAGCSRWQDGCTFSVWREVHGKKLSDSQMKELIQKRRTKVIKGFKKKTGTGTYDARLVINEEFKVRLEFDNPIGADTTLGTCPQCKEGTIRQTPKGAGCNRWKEGCTFSVWREMYGKELSDDQIKELIEKRRTEKIAGFRKKDGSGTYDARLVLNEEFKVRLEFENSAPITATPQLQPQQN